MSIEIAQLLQEQLADERYGFEQCGPFDGYVDDPNSSFMTKVRAA